MNEPIETRSAQIADVSFAERTITLVVVPYDQETIVQHRGEIVRESVEPGAFDGIETRSQHVTANRDHDYTRTVGKAVKYDTTDARGLVADVRVSQTSLGDETLRLAADGVLKASIGMLVRNSDQTLRGGLRRIHRAFLDHIALVPNPAYAGADVLAVRQAQQLGAEGVETPNLEWAAEIARETQRLADESRARRLGV